MEIIESTKNDQIKYIAKLLKSSKTRKEEKAFVVEGPRMVREIPAGLLKKVYLSQSFLDEYLNADIKVFQEQDFFKAFFGEDFDFIEGSLGIVSDSIMKSLSDTVNPKGILAIVRFPEENNFLLFKNSISSGDNRKLSSTSYCALHPVIFLEHIQDPGNLGTIFRTAEAAGVRGIVMSPDTVDIFSPKVVRSTMGSIFRVPFLVCENDSKRFKNLNDDTKDFYEILSIFTKGELKKEADNTSVTAKTTSGIALFGAALDGKKFYDEIDYSSYDGGCGFLIGNEGNGLSEEALSLCTEHIKIPMEGKVESLNAAVSASILMYEAKRQRGHE